MAAPTFVQAEAGAVLASGSTGATLGVLPGGTAPTVGNVVILQVLQDGTGANATISAGASLGDFETLNGTSDSLTSIGTTFNVGSPAAAKQLLWIGRVETVTGGACQINLTTPGDDLYYRIYEFTNVNTGTAITDVIENINPGAALNGAGTSTSVLDTGVTTLGADRLALNFVGINDDATGLAAFAGETGGDWVLPTAIFESATGTDGTIALMTAAMASAGTIDGGSDTITSDGWGVVGFALIGTSAAPPSLVLSQPGLDFGSTAVLMGGIKRAWHRRRSGILIPEYSF